MAREIPYPHVEVRRAFLLIGLLVLSLAAGGGCSIGDYLRNRAHEPFPLRADELPHYKSDPWLHIGMRFDREQGPILPVLIQATNNSEKIWTIDASQVSLETDSCDLKPVPTEEAARMARVPWEEQVGPIVEQMGTFATYSAALGAVTGAIGARTKGDSIVDAVQINTAIGGAIGAVLGMIYETYRLDFQSESPEAGQVNEKMKFLSLIDRSTLYQGYSASGYVYFSNRSSSVGGFCSSRNSADLRLRVLVTLGDPSKDWGAQVTGNVDTYRSPLVCACYASRNDSLRTNMGSYTKPNYFCNPVMDSTHSPAAASICRGIFPYAIFTKESR